MRISPYNCTLGKTKSCWVRTHCELLSRTSHLVRTSLEFRVFSCFRNHLPQKISLIFSKQTRRPKWKLYQLITRELTLLRERRWSFFLWFRLLPRKWSSKNETPLFIWMTPNIGWEVERLDTFEYLTQGKDKIIVQNVRGHDMSVNFFFRGFPWSLGQYLLARICLRGTQGECDLLQLRPLVSRLEKKFAVYPLKIHCNHTLVTLKWT